MPETGKLEKVWKTRKHPKDNENDNDGNVKTGQKSTES